MGDVVDSKPIPNKDDAEFVCDLARFAEGIADEAAIRKKYRLTEAIWTQLADDDELVRAIESEKVRRVRSGQLKRERAQALVVKVPEVAASIAFDANANPRHRLDAGQLLDKLSANEPGQGAPASDRFQITIILNSDVERYDKSIAIDPNDIDPNHIDDTPMIAAIAAKPRESGGGDNTL